MAVEDGDAQNGDANDVLASTTTSGRSKRRVSYFYDCKSLFSHLFYLFLYETRHWSQWALFSGRDGLTFDIAEVGNYHYGETHPMKPHRVRMAHHLIVNYGLYQHLEVFQPQLISKDELTKFHSDDYVHFLSSVTTDNMHEYMRQLQRCNF